MVTKLPAFTRPLVSTIGHFTSAELTNEKADGIRGEIIASNRDFKVKSIDGLKLTVKTDTRNLKTDISKKRKRRLEGEQDNIVKEEYSSQGAIKVTKVKEEMTNQDRPGNQGKVDGVKLPKFEDSLKSGGEDNKLPSKESGKLPRNVQVKFD